MNGVEVRCADGRLTVRLSGWRRLVALQRKVSVPLSAVTSAEAHPDPRDRVGVGARHRHVRGSASLFRYGAYPGGPGWVFWAIDSGRGAVIIGLTGVRYEFVVVEVDDPEATAAAILRAVPPADAAP